MAERIAQSRLRAWVTMRTREYGERKRLSLALGRQDNWVTKFVKDETDADLDDAAGIAKFYKIRLGAVVGEEPLPPADPDIIAFMELIERVPSQFRPELRGVVELFARAPGVGSPPPNGRLDNGRRKTKRKNRQ